MSAGQVRKPLLVVPDGERRCPLIKAAGVAGHVPTSLQDGAASRRPPSVTDTSTS